MHAQRYIGICRTIVSIHFFIKKDAKEVSDKVLHDRSGMEEGGGGGGGSKWRRVKGAKEERSEGGEERRSTADQRLSATQKR